MAAPKALQSPREMLVGYKPATITLRSIAADVVTEPEYYEYPGREYTARLPGGDESPHPLAETAKNPFPGVRATTIARALREGLIKDRGLAKRAQTYVDYYQKRLGQAFYNGRNQDPLPDGIHVNDQQTVTHADPWPPKS